jgi:FMN phosphatase YigB (HAD superfamily)
VVASFDVYDTSLVRLVGAPRSLFLLLGQRLIASGLIACSAEVFARARIAAEERAAKQGAGICTLAAIYAELTSALTLESSQSQAIMDAECGLERELSCPVPSIRDRIGKARRQGRQIAFLTDMYLPAAMIRQQLLEHGLASQSDPLLVSGELSASKWAGGLYGLLGAETGTTPDRISHCGNDWHADVVMARRNGIRSSYAPEGNLNRYEQILEAGSWATGGMTSLLAGASRHARLAVPAATEHEASIRDVAAGVAAPALIGYVMWLLLRARAIRLRRLYFVARDGQLLLSIARKLAPKLRVNCELTYLYGGRSAWWFPSITTLDRDCFDWLLDGDESQLTLGSILTRLRLSRDEIAGSTASIGLKDKGDDYCLSRNERACLFSLICEPSIRALILGKSAEERYRLTKYLSSMGLFDSQDWALADVGWSGRMQSYLGRVLSANGRPPPLGFYWGITGKAPGDCCGRREAYFFDTRTNSGFLRDVWTRVRMVDAMCAGLEGATAGYEVGLHGEVCPRLKQPRNYAFLDWGGSLVHAVSEHMAEIIPLDSVMASDSADLRPAIDEVMQEFWSNPAHSEAIAWAKYPRDDAVGNIYAPLARPLGPGVVMKRVSFRSRGSEDVAYWKAGSLAVSGWPVRVAYYCAQRCAMLVRRAGRRGAMSIRQARRVLTCYLRRP